MKIVAARVIPVRLRFVQPVRTARGVFAERASVLLELRDADGVAGYGEAAPWPGFGTESPATAELGLRELQEWLPGRDLEPAWGSTAPDAPWRDAPTVRAALEGALWDLAARRAGLPLAAYLALHAGRPGGALSRVAVSALLVEREPAELEKEAARAAAAGHRAAKLKLGGAPLREDLARARAARAGLGRGVRLRGDANGAWTLEQALEALEALAPCEFEYMEQPVAADDFDGLQQLGRRALVRVAADESVATEHGVRRLLESRAADVLVLKPAALGGPARALEIAAQARDRGLQVVFTHAFESAIGACHALHCAAAWADADAVHGLVTAGLFGADVAEPVTGQAGWADVSAAAGIGIAP